MYQGRTIRAPFFEIGPKAYLYGAEALKLAEAAQEASREYGVTVLFTPQLTDIWPIAQACGELLVCAPHMDGIPVGRGVGLVLPEAVKAAGAAAVMLNHAERPVTYGTLRETIRRADEVGLLSVVCADSIAETKAITLLKPNVVVAEPSELIGTGAGSDMAYVEASIAAVKSVDPEVLVLQGAGIHNAQDVYDVILAGADATGSSSGIAKAADPCGMARDMIKAVRQAWDRRHLA